MTSGGWRARVTLTALLALAAADRPAARQQSVSEVLSFLLTNRSIPTDDFVQDEEAAAATRDTFTSFLLAELSTLPISSSAGGFTYRLDPALGTVVLSSESFGPFFVERTLTAGHRQFSVGLGYQRAAYQNIDGRNLRDGTLVATASRVRGEAAPFDVETLALSLETDTVTLTGNYGVSDRLDVSAAVPFVRLALNGRRVDTYRGREVIQAIATARASGLGDVVVRAKYNVIRIGSSGLAVGGEVRLPTGSEPNLLGAGRATVQPRLVGTLERGAVGLHGNLGYSIGRVADEWDYGGAVTLVAAPRLTVVGEVIGRRLSNSGRLIETTSAHPRLAGIDTIRLTSLPVATTRAVAVVGVKWNIVGAWLLSGHVIRPLTRSGLNARWVPTVTFDYSFGR